MTQSSPARLERKNNKKKPHQNQSFEQLVADSQIARLKPYIQEQVGFACQQVFQQVQQFILFERAAIQTRQLAFERLLKANTTWFTEDLLAAEVAAVEDDASGYEVVSDGIKEGDKVRVEFTAKPSSAQDWLQSTRLAIHQVMVKGPNGNVQTHEELEKTIIGMKLGETSEFLVIEPQQEGQEPENTRCKVTISRVSRKKEVKPQ